MGNNIVENSTFGSAEEFYKLISDSRDYPQYVFRGQGCSTYDLEPGITRDTKYLEQFYMFGDLFLSGIDYRKYEYEILRYFIKGCDKTGISIPNDGHDLRLSFGLSNSRINVPFAVSFDEDELGGVDVPGHWPDSNSYSVMIMAQHHGVPTRLLDWTGSILTAMYFASVGGMKKLIHLNEEQVQGKRIAIWSLNGSRLNELSDRCGFVLLKPPTSLSVNISPQEGFFTTLIGSGDDRQRYVLNKQNVAGECLRAFFFDIKESISMYIICKKNGYTGAMLFPGLDGAAKEAAEMSMLRLLRKRFKV